MISFEEAYKIVIDSQYYEVNTERIELNKSIGRVLAKDILSDINMPPFNKSAMDGYACRRADLKNELEVLEVIPAGSIPTKSVGVNQCSKIMTGAKVPDGADCVIKVEDTEEQPNAKVKFVVENTKDNYVPFGQDVKEGDLVLKKGTLIGPQHIAVAASVGYDFPRVFKKVRVGVISTGDELVEPFSKPGEGQIRNSNAYQLIGQLSKMNVTPYYFGIARDNEESTTRIITKALSETDVVLLTGGVSMGDFDFIPKIFDQLGVDIKFSKLAVQPGKPAVFGVLKNKFIFGLPGNPVSSFNIFEILAKPFIYALMGHKYEAVRFRVAMGTGFKRKRSERKLFMPVKIENGKVWPVVYHGSAHIQAMTEAHGFISIPIGISEIKEGDLVDVRQI